MAHFSHRIARPHTSAVIDMIEDGILDPKMIAQLALNWIPDDEVKQLMQANGIKIGHEDE